MINNLDQLRAHAVRHIVRQGMAEHLLRHALCKRWVASTHLDEMAWTDFKTLFFNFPLLQAQLNGADSAAQVWNERPLEDSDRITAFMAAICHEISHVLWLHKYRSKGKNQAVWAEACEYAINIELVKYFGTKWIEHLGVMYPSNELPQALAKAKLAPTTDNIYELLLKRADLRPSPHDRHKSCKFCSRREDAEEADPSESVVRVLNSLPPKSAERNDILKYLISEQQEARKIPWEMLLMGGIEDAVNQEQSWALPSRRNDLLPGWRHEKLLSFVWILDVSPSIDDDMKKSFMNTVQAGINLYHDAQHRIIFFAEEVVADITVSSGTDLSKIEIPYGSGTDLTDTWKILERDLPEYALVLTDLELNPVPKPSFTKIVWGIVGRNRIFDPDYGTKIVLK